MIKKSQQVRLDFGKGNIGIRITRDLDKSYLVFSDVEHQSIGDEKPAEDAGMTIMDLLDAPVLISFSNIESIDAMILALEKARSCMNH